MEDGIVSWRGKRLNHISCYWQEMLHISGADGIWMSRAGVPGTLWVQLHKLALCFEAPVIWHMGLTTVSCAP